MESSGGNLSHAGERGDADGFWSSHRVPGVREGPGGGTRETVSGFDSGSARFVNAYDVRGERGTDENAGDGVLGGREQSHGNRDDPGDSRGGRGVGGRVELFRAYPGVEGGRLGNSAVEHRGQCQPAGAGTVRRPELHGAGHNQYSNGLYGVLLK